MKKTPFISMLASCALLAVWSPSVQAAPDARWWKPLQVARGVEPASCAKPRGIRLLVRGYFDVTNSDDGFKDDDVEVFGFVTLNGQSLWNVARKNAINATNKGRKIYLFERTFDVIYDDASTWKISLSGYMNDRDKASSNDTLWNSRNTSKMLDFKQLSEGLNVPGAGGRELTLLGDRKSESADLHLFINRSSDIF